MRTIWRWLRRVTRRGPTQESSPSRGAPAGVRTSPPPPRAPSAPAPVLASREGVPFRWSPSRPVDAIIGVDFGTSCSKVVVRTPFVDSGRAVAIPSPGGDPTGPFLVPTRLFVRSGGHLSLSRTTGCELRSDLKVRLWDHPEDPEAREDATGYLALLMRHARDWFLATQSRELGIHEVAWSANVGIPSPGYDDERFRSSFALVARAGAALAAGTRAIEEASVREALSDCPPGPPVDVVPEIVAASVGYARSAFNQKGLHVVLDVGATTTDICGLILADRDEADRFVLLGATVRPFGARELHRHRVRTLRGRYASLPLTPYAVGDPDPMLPLADNIEEYVASHARDGLSIEELDAPFARRIAEQAMELIVDVRLKRDRRARAWDTGLPFFLTGGGARAPFYSRVVAEVNKRCTRRLKLPSFRDGPLPVPLKIVNVRSEDVFARLGVAYGLTFDGFDLGEIVRPSEVEDQRPPQRRAFDDRDASR